MTSKEALSSIAFSMKYRCSPKYVYKVENDNFTKIEKDLEVLDIIKDKMVDIHNFKKFIIKQNWTYEQYLDEENDINTSGHQFAYKLLTKEEYDLLKERLEK